MAWLRRRLMPSALPLALLLLALATVFPSGNDRGHFYRSPLHNAITADHMAVAKNLSPKHGFLGFGSLRPGSDGAPVYWRPYNRLPIGGYALVKLTILPFEDDFPAEIRAARVLMLVFFVLGAVLAYLSLCRLTASRWVALAATLLSFSSFWLLYYNDMVATENMPSLFGVMLAFHGMVVFVQEGRFRQLLAKACAALLLGWHVYALLLPFIVFGLVRELMRALPLPSRLGQWNQARGGPPAPGRYLALGVVTLLFGAALLSFNLGNEYFAHGGAKPLTELPTVTSIAKHLGANEELDALLHEKLAWSNLLEKNLRRTGGMTLPYGLIEPIWGTVVDRSFGMKFLPGLLALGIVACGVCLMGLPFLRHRLLLAALVLSGFCWALPMRRHTALHEFETVFYIGIPLTVFLLVFSCIRKLAGDRFVAILAAAACPVFLLSSAKMAAVRPDVPDAVLEAELMRDFEVIRGKVEEGVVRLIPGHEHVIAGMPFNRLEYFLTGKLLVSAGSPRQDRADFVLLPHRDEGPALLTPDNWRMFLYDRVLHDASYDEPALGSPIIASDWNVYLKDGRLVYVDEDCANTNSRFFLYTTPREGSGPAERRRRGVDGMEFGFRDAARLAGGKCVAVIELPNHDLLAVRTGQVDEEGLLWEGEHRFER